MSNADYSNWMGNLPERLTKVPLGHLAIPGSHNSFTSTLDPSLGVAVDQSESIQNLGSSCCGAVTKIIQRWSTNQSMAMLDQLTAGIRYFDLRVCKKPDTEQFHFLHGLYGDNVKSLLGTIKTFFEDNPKEVAIFDMNHFYNMEPSDHDRLLWEIEDTVGDLLVPVNGYQYKLWSLTLANIWNHPGRIILIYHNPFNAATFPKIWNKNVIQSPWPNTSSKESLVDFLETNYTEKKRPPGYTFYVWQGCLTPGTGTIALRLCCSLENALARPATTAFVNWVKNKAPGDTSVTMWNPVYSKWMSNLPDHLTTVPPAHLAIPGSHNSFISALYPSLGVSVDKSECIQILGSYSCGAVTKIIQRWSTNQSMAMLDQLTAGIRYFDLRMCKKPDAEQFHFLHGLYGDNVKSLLGTIKTFFEDNPKEVAILDMNLFYNMEPSDHDRLLWEIEYTVGDLLVPVNGYQYKLWNLTLANIWNHPGRIILIYHNPFNAATFQKIWNKNVIRSPWRNLWLISWRQITPRKNDPPDIISTCGKGA